MKNHVLGLVFLLTGFTAAYSQTLTITPFSAGYYTRGNTYSLSIPYTSSGATFAAGNTFTAQLSDATGSFAAPTVLGTAVVSTAASGTLAYTFTIPAAITLGSGYRIRVVSSNVALLSNNNNSNINISSCPSKPVKPSPFIPAVTSVLPNSGVSGGASSGAMPSSSGNFVFPTGSTSHTITSGTINNALSMFVPANRTLTINYEYSINAGGSLNIYVDANGTLNLNVMFNLNGGNFYNFNGTINFVSNGMQNACNFYIIGPNALLSTPNINLTASTGRFLIDEGSVVVSGSISVQSAPSEEFCMTNYGCISTTNIPQNDRSFTFTTPDNRGLVYMKSTTYTANTNNTILNTVALNTPKLCTGEATPNADWCGGNVACAAQIRANCSPTPATCAGAIPLPVTLRSFKASVMPEGVLLKWAISKAWDSKNFIVEKSRDGKEWELVGMVDSYNGFANREYSLTDSRPEQGGTYYRLSESDIRGNINIYAVDYIKIDEDANYFSIYPNPLSQHFTVSISGEYNEYLLEILDLNGKLLNSYILTQGQNNIRTELPAGVYLAKLKVQKDYKMLKLIVR